MYKALKTFKIYQVNAIGLRRLRNCQDLFPLLFRGKKIKLEDELYLKIVLKNQNPHFKNHSSCQLTDKSIDFIEYGKYFSGESPLPMMVMLGALAVSLAVCSERPKYIKRLFWAAKVGDAEGIKRLREEGWDMNMRHILGWTALHVAAINGNYEAVKTLLNSARYQI